MKFADHDPGGRQHREAEKTQAPTVPMMCCAQHRLELTWVTKPTFHKPGRGRIHRFAAGSRALRVRTPHFRLAMTAVAITSESATSVPSVPSAPSRLTPMVLRTWSA